MMIQLRMLKDHFCEVLSISRLQVAVNIPGLKSSRQPQSTKKFLDWGKPRFAVQIRGIDLHKE